MDKSVDRNKKQKITGNKEKHFVTCYLLFDLIAHRVLHSFSPAGYTMNL